MIEFRNYVEDDYLEVASILEQLSTIEKLTKEKIKETHRNLTNYGPDIRTVGHINGKIVCYGVGVLDLKVRGGLCMHIEDIAVAKEMHRQGIGQSLIMHLLEQANKLGCYKIQLTTTPNNIEFYKKCGLKLDGSIQFTKLFHEKTKGV